MEKQEKKEEELIEERKEKIKNWLKDPYNFTLVLVGLFVVLLYLYYFFKLGTQPIWWDEGDYLSIGKELSFARARPDWWTDFLGIRPLAFPLILAFLFKIGLSELPVRFLTELLPALASIFLIYIISSKLFNKKIGIIASFLLSVNWVYMFYSFRLLTDIPSLFFSALAIYFFWIKYETPIINNEKPNQIFLYLAVIFGVLSFFTRYVTFLTSVIIAFYLLITRKFSLIKDRTIWMAALIGLLCATPYFIYNYNTQGSIFPALSWYQGAESTAIHRPAAWNTITFHLPNFFGYSGSPEILKSFEMLLFIIGFFIFLSTLLYFDVIWRQKDRSKNGLLFCLLGVIIPLAYFIFGIRAVDARYFIATAPLMFPAVALAIYSISKWIANITKVKYISVIVIILLVGMVSYQNLVIANSFIISRSTSYQQIQEAGIWIKENSNFNDKIITASVTQMEYYTERINYGFIPEETIPEWDQCYYTDAQLVRRISSNETCTKITKGIFHDRVKKINPRYYIIHVFEPVFTPEWAYTYPQEYNLTLDKIYSEQGQPILAIYEFPSNFTSSLQ